MARTPPIQKPLAKEVTTAAMPLHRRTLWERFGRHDAFAVRLSASRDAVDEGSARREHDCGEELREFGIVH